MLVADLDLDLDVFTGPFDLLLSLVLREEVDLLDVDLAEVVVSYLDHLEAAGAIDLESATEFLVLIAALLELKSRLMLPREDELGLEELEPGEAAEELLARLLAHHRYRGAGAFLASRLVDESGRRFRSAPLPPGLRRARLDESAVGVYDPALLGRAVGELLRTPKPIDVRHMAQVRVSVADRLAHLRAFLRRGSFSFDEAVARADRMTVAITLYALLELHKHGEATWDQDGCFGAIRVSARDGYAKPAGAVA